MHETMCVCVCAWDVFVCACMCTVVLRRQPSPALGPSLEKFIIPGSGQFLPLRLHGFSLQVWGPEQHNARERVVRTGESWPLCVLAKSLQSCPTLCDPMDCSPPGSSVHGILQARILEWVAMPFSRGSPHPGIKPVSLISPALAGEFFTISATWEVPWPLAEAKVGCS